MFRIPTLAISFMAGAAALSGAPLARGAAVPVKSKAKPGRAPAGFPFPDELARESSDPGHITVAVKFVEFMDAGKPILSQEQVRDVIRGVNRIYGACNMHFRVEEYVPADPLTYGLAYHLTSMGQLDPVRGPFDSPNVLVVTNTGSWDHQRMGSPNAWTAMPGESPAGAVLEAPVAHNANIVAHELGHYLGLDHVQDMNDLMNPIIYSFSTKFTPSQCETMRQVASSDRARALRGMTGTLALDAGTQPVSASD